MCLLRHYLPEINSLTLSTAAEWTGSAEGGLRVKTVLDVLHRSMDDCQWLVMNCYTHNQEHCLLNITELYPVVMYAAFDSSG